MKRKPARPVPIIRRPAAGAFSLQGNPPVMAWSIVYSPGGGGSGNTINAASAALADVQAAVDAAADGDTVLIPNGSATWSTGITTTKQIIIRAQNYTPTQGGTMTRNVTITAANASGVSLFKFTSGNSYPCGIGGIRFNQGTSQGPLLYTQGTGSRPPVMFDCALETDGIGGSAEANSRVVWLALGGIIWNTYVDGTNYPVNASDLGNSIAVNWLHVKSPRAWTTASTMGTADSSGNQNLYIEDSTLKNTCSFDIDDNGRIVIRYCNLIGTRVVTHGFTSSWGGRFIEVYNNAFTNPTQPRNLAGAYCWFRAGHGVFFNNSVATNPTGDYAAPYLFTCVVESGTYNMTWGGSWIKPRQVGCGHDGANYVSDPIYFWNNTGDRATYIAGTSDTPGVNIGRDLITSGAAKPGYSAYTYPHPSRI